MGIFPFWFSCSETSSSSFLSSFIMYLYPCLAICQVNVMCVADCIVSLRHKKLIQKQSLLKHIRIWVMGICFAAICFLLNIVLTGFIKKILVLVMI